VALIFEIAIVFDASGAQLLASVIKPDVRKRIKPNVRKRIARVCAGAGSSTVADVIRSWNFVTSCARAAPDAHLRGSMDAIDFLLD
jgi:hypothetical protein